MLRKTIYGWRGAGAARTVIIDRLWSEFVPQRLWESTVGVKENLPVRRQPASRQQDKPEDLPRRFSRWNDTGRIEVSNALLHVRAGNFLTSDAVGLKMRVNPAQILTGSVRSHLEDELSLSWFSSRYVVCATSYCERPSNTLAPFCFKILPFSFVSRLLCFAICPSPVDRANGLPIRPDLESYFSPVAPASRRL